jgi:hypothetical protein
VVDLRARLQNVNEAGVYRLNCPVNDLRLAAAQIGFELFEAELAQVHDKTGFIAAVAEAVNAPVSFANNWDALADTLGDLSWHPAPGYVLLLGNGGESLGLPAPDLNVANPILLDTVAFWKSLGKPFWVFRC